MQATFHKQTEQFWGSEAVLRSPSNCRHEAQHACIRQGRYGAKFKTDCFIKFETIAINFEILKLSCTLSSSTAAMTIQETSWIVCAVVFS